MSKIPTKASDPNDLERRILDPNIAKSEAEWWAKRRIEELERQHEQSLARIRNQVLDEAINVAWNHEPDSNGPIEMALRKLKEPE